VSRRKGKKKRKKRRREQRRALQRRPKRRVRTKSSGQKVVVVRPRDGVKMSAVLEQFMEPYRKSADTLDTYRKLLAMGAIGWNMTLLPEEDRQSAFDDALAMLPKEVRNDGKKIIEELMERKERYFSQYRRMILDLDVVDTGDTWHLSVISTVGPA